jgi:phage terminase small subunit
VNALLDIMRAQREQRTNLTADSVLHEMSLLSNSDLSHYVIDDNGHVQLAAGAPEGAMRAIQSIKRKKTIKEDKDGNVTITYDVEIKLWDKPAPLKLMGRHVGLFPDKVELSTKDGKPLEVVTRIERVVVNATKKE